jgi:hypothetical protein
MPPTRDAVVTADSTELAGLSTAASSARGRFNELVVDLATMSIDLADRSTLVILFDIGPGFGSAPGEQLPGYAGRG